MHVDKRKQSWATEMHVFTVFTPEPYLVTLSHL